MDVEPRCEVEFKPKTGEAWKIRFFNCSDDREQQKRIRDRRLDQITKQLDCPHGLTNRERRRLNKERTILQNAFLQTAEGDGATEAKQQKKRKASEKKLAWRVRKIAREQRN
jgi:hypothetical protein